MCGGKHLSKPEHTNSTNQLPATLRTQVSNEQRANHLVSCLTPAMIDQIRHLKPMTPVGVDRMCTLLKDYLDKNFAMYVTK